MADKLIPRAGDGLEGQGPPSRVGGSLATPQPSRAAKNPAGLYLASLLPSGRLVMAGALNIIARDFLGFKNAREVPWAQLGYEHAQAIRTSWTSATSLPRRSRRLELVFSSPYPSS